jgi:helicase
MRIEELKRFGFPEKAINILKAEGIETLFEPQEIAVNQGILDLKDSYLLSVPTASGKTLISELVMITSLLRERDRGNKKAKCLYIVPLKALAYEKFNNFKKWEKLGIHTGISTGDLDSGDPWLAGYDIIVSTSEKVDSLTRHTADWLKNLVVLVVDEIHLVHDSKRGPTLEVVIARMLHLLPELLIIALSATVKNVDEIATWLSAKLVESDWRPVKLREGVYYNNSILFNDSKLEDVRTAGRNLKEIATSLSMLSVDEGGQSLVFLNTRRSVESFADGGKKRFGIALKKGFESSSRTYKDLYPAFEVHKRWCCIPSRRSSFTAAQNSRRRIQNEFTKDIISHPDLGCGC